MTSLNSTALHDVTCDSEETNLIKEKQYHEELARERASKDATVLYLASQVRPKDFSSARGRRFDCLMFIIVRQASLVASVDPRSVKNYTNKDKYDLSVWSYEPRTL
jgi:hypothetical protein